MAKRKAVVSDIIYELDHDDITLSSDEEPTPPKNQCTEISKSPMIVPSDSNSQDSATEVIDVDSSLDIINCDAPSPLVENGGKKLDDIVLIDDDVNKTSPECSSTKVVGDNISATKGSEGNKTTIFHEDIDIDSPGNSDLGVVGCENRTPLVTVRFKDNQLAMNYKKKLKAFMLSLIKLNESEVLESGSDTDLELDIWPEDLEDTVAPEKEDSSFFFVDTAPCEQKELIPAYNTLKDESLLSNAPDIPAPSPTFIKRGPMCFNCDGDHALRDCKKPKNFPRINEMRAKRTNKKTERYHMEDDQRFGHMVPGRISGKLRDALGLKRYELPLHIYRMRVLGYPPAWLEEARISHSGISLFDSSGRATLEPDEEEGEVSEPGSKDKFDIKKIWDFPGFNIPASKRYVDESEFHIMPPMSEKDSKLAMLQVLAPNAMKAYKRKKLTYFPSATADTSQGGQAEMEIDSGDEALDFPSAPPLPDEAPPPPPPPPTSAPPIVTSHSIPPAVTPATSKSISFPPLPPGPPPETKAMDDVGLSSISKSISLPPLPAGPPPETAAIDDADCLSDTPMSLSDIIVLDEEGESEPGSGRSSPSLDDLEDRKRLLLEALYTENSQDTGVSETTDITSNVRDIPESSNKKTESTQTEDDDKPTSIVNIDESKETLGSNSTNTEATEVDTDNTVLCTPEAKLKTVRTEYGTPIIDSVTNYTKIPSDDKFAKNICDVINFENLPNSTGKYKQISTLLKKVKDKVDRIQDS